MVDGRVHTPKVAGSSPAPATFLSVQQKIKTFYCGQKNKCLEFSYRTAKKQIFLGQEKEKRG